MLDLYDTLALSHCCGEPLTEAGRCSGCKENEYIDENGECDHPMHDIEVTDEGFNYAGTHATGGQAGSISILVARCSGCGAEVDMPINPNEDI